MFGQRMGSISFLSTACELARKQDQVLLLSRGAEDWIIYFLIEMSQRVSPNENLSALPMTRQTKTLR
jgi:hypothetical protein